MNKIILAIVSTVLVLGLLPFALIARSRASQYDALPPHLVLDMDKQPKFKNQRSTPLFADTRSMRPQVEGTLAREDMMVHAELLNDPMNPHLIAAFAGNKTELDISDPTLYAAVMLGRVRPAKMSDQQFNALTAPNANDQAIANDTTFYVKKIPSQIAVSPELLKRGQERFNIYCSPCHGESGYGDGMIARRAERLALTPDLVAGWAPPQNLHDPKILTRPDGHIFNTITNGVRNMPAYDKQVSVIDRWSIIAYIRALETSQNAPAQQ
jgi:mono/diheme cytochrome c family protein